MRPWALVATGLLAGCGHRGPAQVAQKPHYVVGAPYQIGGTWYYPRESFAGEETGLAEVLPDRGGLTADGELFDAAAMAGAHHTLQLPAIVRVTNLENGRQVEIRVNDRGPAGAGRILGVSRKAAELLGMRGATQVRVETERAPSEALRDQLQGGPKGVTGAPVAAVLAEDLPAPGQRARSMPASQAKTAGYDSAAAVVPEQLPARFVQGTAQPGQLWVQAGRFSAPGYANALKARLSGLPVRVRREAGGQLPAYVVEAGPFADPAAADNALDQARASGVTDGSIVVE